MTAKTNLPSIPLAIADVAMIDGPTAAAAASISISQWHELVRRRQAPQPVIRRSRCTRWRLADVRYWLVDLAEKGSDDVDAAALVTARARKASAKAQANRAAKVIDAMAAGQ